MALGVNDESKQNRRSVQKNWWERTGGTEQRSEYLQISTTWM